MKIKKYIYVIDGILVVGTLIVLFLFLSSLGIGATGMAIGPIRDSTNVLIYLEDGNKLLVDEDIEFFSPMVYNINDGVKIFFEPGNYYLMVSENEGLRDEVMEFTVESGIELKIKKIEESYGLVNIGNYMLNVDVYEGGKFVESVKIEGSNE